MSRIFWDTNLFIYLFERHPEFSERTIALRKRMLEREDQLLASTMTLAEVQVGPMQALNPELGRQYRESIRQAAIITAFDEKAADIYAAIRVGSKVRGPDAIQLACAAAAGTELFITNDNQLHQLKVPGIHFITSLERVPI